MAGKLLPRLPGSEASSSLPSHAEESGDEVPGLLWTRSSRRLRFIFGWGRTASAVGGRREAQAITSQVTWASLTESTRRQKAALWAMAACSPGSGSATRGAGGWRGCHRARGPRLLLRPLPGPGAGLSPLRPGPGYLRGPLSSGPPPRVGSRRRPPLPAVLPRPSDACGSAAPLLRARREESDASRIDASPPGPHLAARQRAQEGLPAPNSLDEGFFRHLDL